MRRIRLTLTDAAILIAIVGLLCAVPLHFRRYVDRDMCRYLGESYIARGSEVAAMAEHPEPWMDPFREDFRRFSVWQLEKGRRILRSSVYDEAEEERRIVEAGKDRYKIAFDKVYAKFKGVAALNGYRRPHIPLRYYPGGDLGAFFAAWPLYGGVALLGVLLVVRRRRAMARTRPRVERWSWEAAMGHFQRGMLLLGAGMATLFYSLILVMFSGGPPMNRYAGWWVAIPGKMSEPTAGHGILSLLGLVASVVGAFTCATAFRDWWRRPPIDTAIPDRGEQAGLPDFPRADGLDPSP